MTHSYVLCVRARACSYQSNGWRWSLYSIESLLTKLTSGATVCLLRTYF